MIVGTAGHIDHGKSALVTALTGRSVDRLVEEQRRGMTIDLNFAPLRFEGLPTIGIVDVPGHEDFVRTMVAGATGIDLVLLVVDLGEGPRPQTEEHLAVVEQLRIARGIPVFTKADLVDREWTDLVVAETMARLGRSGVGFGPPAVVSAVTGQGIDELRARLRAEAVASERRSVEDAFRMPVDRVFSLAGVGTVVTGTTWSGSVAVGDTVRILPAGVSARVRSVQAYGEPVASAVPGTRTSLGLAGVDREAVARGAVAVDARWPWEPTLGFDAEIDLMPGAARPLTGRSRVRVLAGTAELIARAYPRGTIAPGHTGLARLRLEATTVLRGGDRFVLRSFSPVATIGGGRVLDPWLPVRAGWPEGLGATDPADRLGALVARRRHGLERERVTIAVGIPPAAAERLSEACAGVVAIAGRLLARAAVAGLEARVLTLVERHHRAAPADPGLSLETIRRAVRAPDEVTDQVLDRLERRKALRRHEGVAALPGFAPTYDGGSAAVQELIGRIEAAALEPPSIAELSRAAGIANLQPLIRVAVEQGAIEAVERDRFYAVSELERFRKVLRDIGEAGPITPASVRDRLGLSRKFTIPLLEWADRRGITRRDGDQRILVDSGS